MDANKLAVRPALAKAHAARRSELRHTRPIIILLRRQRHSDLLNSLRNEKASLPIEPTAFTKRETIAILRGSLQTRRRILVEIFQFRSAPVR